MYVVIVSDTATIKTGAVLCAGPRRAPPRILATHDVRISQQVFTDMVGVAAASCCNPPQHRARIYGHLAQGRLHCGAAGPHRPGRRCRGHVTGGSRPAHSDRRRRWTPQDGPLAPVLQTHHQQGAPVAADGGGPRAHPMCAPADAIHLCIHRHARWDGSVDVDRVLFWCVDIMYTRTTE
jgi:hypothetical protein